MLFNDGELGNSDDWARPWSLRRQNASYDIVTEEAAEEAAEEAVEEAKEEAVAEAKAEAVREEIQEYANSKTFDLWFLITNITFLVLGIVSFVMVFRIFDSHAADMRNNLLQHTATIDLTAATAAEEYASLVTPCGIGAPDVFKLDAALGIRARTGVANALLQPDYFQWVEEAKSKLCNSVFVHSDGGATPQLQNVEALAFVTDLLGDWTNAPEREDDQAAIDAKIEAVEATLCREPEHSDVGRVVYPETELDAFGDLNERIARAYAASAFAAGAFAHYQETGPDDPFMCLGDDNPFASPPVCTNAPFIWNALPEAVSAMELLVSPSTSEYPSSVVMLYRLYIVAVAAHIDKHKNDGTCLGNINQKDSAVSVYSMMHNRKCTHTHTHTITFMHSLRTLDS
jgi:hypothetical protein